MPSKGGGGAQGSSSRGGDGDDEDVYDLRCVLYHKGSNVHSGHIVAEVRRFSWSTAAAGGCCGCLLYLVMLCFFWGLDFGLEIGTQARSNSYRRISTPSPVLHTAG